MVGAPGVDVYYYLTTGDSSDRTQTCSIEVSAAPSSQRTAITKQAQTEVCGLAQKKYWHTVNA
ncbi:hypothetical protein TSMEX_008735 [Taenia solium]|eukprot:TsM_001207800 transcript=TsM_001207800 gene=TsM_001207800